MNDDSLLIKIIGGTLAGILIFIIAIPIFIYMIWASAYVGATLWSWFVVPTFGLPALTLGQAWGLAMLINMWTYQHVVWKAEDTRDTQAKVTEILILFLRPWLILFFGWVCHRWFMPA